MNAYSYVLAIDPGPVKSAWVVWDGEKIWEFGLKENEAVIPQVRALACVGGYELAIEMIASYGMPVGADVFDTCVWIGRFIEAWEPRNSSGAGVTLVKRGDVKMHLCQSMRAKDSNIRQALLDRVGPQGTKAAPGPTYAVKKDVWAALGVAVTYWDTMRV